MGFLPSIFLAARASYWWSWTSSACCNPHSTVHPWGIQFCRRCTVSFDTLKWPIYIGFLLYFAEHAASLRLRLSSCCSIASKHFFFPSNRSRKFWFFVSLICKRKTYLLLTRFSYMWWKPTDLRLSASASFFLLLFPVRLRFNYIHVLYSLYFLMDEVQIEFCRCYQS